MTTREYKLKVKVNIDVKNDRNVLLTAYKAGDILTVDESTFERLLRGEDISSFYNMDGIIYFNKKSFENEVEYTEVQIKYGTRKLGQRNNK